MQSTRYIVKRYIATPVDKLIKQVTSSELSVNNHIANINEKRYCLTRFSMYNSLEKFIKEKKYSGKVLLISERQEQSIRNMFQDTSEFISTDYPEVDIMDLSNFEDESFDFIITDQILEHIPNPWTALQEVQKKLKIGGIAINTSCSFHPIHDASDYYRFTVDGFKYIHETCIGKILLLDYWGNREAIAAFVKDRHKVTDVRANDKDLELATRKEPNWPWVVWCIAQKKSKNL